MRFIFLGAGWSGMSWLCRFLHDLRKRDVIGIDTWYGPPLDMLIQAGVTIHTTFGSVPILPTDIVIYTDIPAIKQTPEYQASIARPSSRTNVPLTLSFHHCVAEISKRFSTLAIAWSNGKTSSTTMAIHAMKQLLPNQRAWGMVGSMVTERWNTGFVANPTAHDDITTIIDYLFRNKGIAPYELVGKWRCVIEADEFNRHCLLYNPSITIITTIDHDHSDCFPTLESYHDVFRRLTATTKRAVITDPHLLSILTPTDTPIITSSSIQDCRQAQFFSPLHHLRWPHNIANASMVMTAIKTINPWLSDTIIWETIAHTPPLARRTEIIGQLDNLTIISDYAHHPPAIKPTLQWIRDHYPHLPLTIIWEPHQARRMLDGRDTWREVFASEDLIIVPPYTARESIDEYINHPLFTQYQRQSFDECAQALAHHCHAQRCASFETLWNRLQEKKSDWPRVIVLMTAGVLDPWMRRKLKTHHNTLA